MDTARLQSPYVLTCWTLTPSRSPPTRTGSAALLWWPTPEQIQNSRVSPGHFSSLITRFKRGSWWTAKLFKACEKRNKKRKKKKEEEMSGTDLSVHPPPSHRRTQSPIQSGINCGPAHTPPRGYERLLNKKKNYLNIWAETFLYLVHNTVASKNVGALNRKPNLCSKLFKAQTLCKTGRGACAKSLET